MQLSILPVRISRAFSTSAALLRERAPTYLINGSALTREEILRVHPTDRSVAHWAVLVDWDLQRTRQYVIVDPMDPQGLLYLNHAEYLSQMKVCASASLMMIVVARPGTKSPIPSSDPSQDNDPSSQNSPPFGVRIESKWSRNSRTSWATFLELRKQILRISNRKAGSKMVSESDVTIDRTLYTWVRQLAHYAEVKHPGTYIRYFIPLVQHLQKIMKHNGQMAAVTHLKVSLFALYSYISGNPLKSTTPLGHGIRLVNGLPKYWDVELRRFVKEGRMQQIRILASVLNLYRAMQAPHPDFSVETIVQPHPNLDGETWEEFKIFAREEFPKWLKDHSRVNPEFRYASGLGHLVWSAGANVTGSAMAGITRDARAWFVNRKDTSQDPLVQQWFDLHEDRKASLQLRTSAIESHFNLRSPDKGFSFSQMFFGTRDAFSSNASVFPPLDPHEGVHAPILGRLHAIDEPAGKVRVVAICDYWTQVAMKPVHEHLFKILRGIKTDATFDQIGRVNEYHQRDLSPHWSFDLKSATDLIPLSLYVEVLTPLLIRKGETYEAGRKRVELWSRILTDRDWLLPDKSGFVRYGTGQPMGALSSWASMAVVHHALVQFAAKRAGYSSWFTDYCILGDDIDIARDPRVAEGYQHICAETGIKIGLLKSLKSAKNCFEFANQRFCPEGNISPLSYKEELVAQSWTGRLEFARRILSRFGTSLKDKDAALLRKTATNAQWSFLQSELSGSRPSSFLNLFRFCLLTPFQNWRGIKVESIFKWLGDAVSDSDRLILNTFLNSPERVLEIQSSLHDNIISDLTERLKEIARSPVPYEFAHKKATPIHLAKPTGSSENWSDANLKKFLEARARGVLPFPIESDSKETKEFYRLKIEEFKKIFSWNDRSDVPALPDERLGIQTAIFSIIYVMDCVHKHNLRVFEDAVELLTDIKLYLRVREVSTTGSKSILNFFQRNQRPRVAQILNDNRTPLEIAISYWDEFSSLSSRITPDLTRPLSEWMPKKDDTTPATGIFAKGLALSPSPQAEALRAPIRAILRSVTETTGVIVPELPYQIRSGTKGGKWLAVLRLAAKNYKSIAEIRTHLDKYLRVAKRSVWLRRVGGRKEVLPGF